MLKPLPVTNTNDFLKRATSVASFYGFMPLEKALAGYKTVDKKARRVCSPVIPQKDIPSKELAEIFRRCALRKHALFEKPLLIYRAALINERLPGGRTKEPLVSFSIASIGIKKSIAEALVLHTAYIILENNGFQNHALYINSIGDSDSEAQYGRELALCFKKNENQLPALSRAGEKRDVFSTLEYLRQRKQKLESDIPASMNYLSNASRKHLREVFEYLEAGNMPYSIDDMMVGHKNYYRETFFEIRSDGANDNNDEQEVLARGGRCDEITKQFFRLSVPAVGIVFVCQWKSKRTTLPPLSKRSQKPRFYFVQFGTTAKLKSLSIIESLRKANVPLFQSLGEDTLTEQLAEARLLAVPYALIVGQKEAIEDTVLVRNMNTQAQEAVLVSELPAYLKKIK